LADGISTFVAQAGEFHREDRFQHWDGCPKTPVLLFIRL